MPERRTNPIARIFAVVGLATVFLLVVIVIATGGGDSNDNGGSSSGGGQTSTTRGPTAEGKKAVEAGVWIVREGDTLTQISEQTGIEIDDLVDLNPDADPQALIAGQRIALR
jgi:LysM repeat protein